MDIQEFTDKINSFDVNDIDWNNMGSWPLVGRAIFAIIVFFSIVIGLYFIDIQGDAERFNMVVAKEEVLRENFETKAFRVANLDAYKKQLTEIEESFGSLLRQLPRDTEVPGLLEDITAAAVGASLEIKSIALNTYGYEAGEINNISFPETHEEYVVKLDYYINDNDRAVYNKSRSEDLFPRK